MELRGECQGKGVGKSLFNAFVNEFNRRGIKEFRVVVGDTLARAKRFYKKRAVWIRVPNEQLIA